MEKHFVYVLLSTRDGKLYIGQTSNHPEFRLREHNLGRVTSTKVRRPFELIYYEMYRLKRDALGREKFLKGGSGHKYLSKQLKWFFDMHRGVEQPGSSQGSILGSSVGNN
ncbi:MAG: GIY-YIG nuclease family protein [Candidatus Omnitrophica bacterium]|nr:GIY-YIG nuclease family protein [Candidatus Omnitrophota bacterium]